MHFPVFVTLFVALTCGVLSIAKPTNTDRRSYHKSLSSKHRPPHGKSNHHLPSNVRPWDILKGGRKDNILADIKGHFPLPDPGQMTKAALNTSDVQGDILVGMKKKLEVFYFFSIENPASFKKKLRTDIVPMITSVSDLSSVSTQPVALLNIAFSHTGLQKLGFDTDLGDNLFGKGQAADAFELGDPGTSNWDPAFQGTGIHGLFLIASDSQQKLDAQISVLEDLLGADITDLYELQGNIRPPPFEGHEMFGYLDGIAQPAVAGFTPNPLPGQEIVPPGIILVGEPGDGSINSRPSWAKDGSFLVFRQLQQLVPEFDEFVLQNAPQIPGKNQQQSADLLGARMVGRWKSGAPIDLAPFNDDPALGSDPNRNNNFNFLHPGFSPLSDQTHCPFAAHIRKTKPRTDLPGAAVNSIMRAGIPYGPEVTDDEKAQKKSSDNEDLERGTAFVAYQSSITQGFKTLQTVWANDPNFPPNKNQSAGWEPLIGANHGNERFMNGYNIRDTSSQLKLMQDFVVSRGGEYFFSPSISALRNKLSV